jgi:hypothetical protein
MLCTVSSRRTVSKASLSKPRQKSDSSAHRTETPEYVPAHCRSSFLELLSHGARQAVPLSVGYRQTKQQRYLPLVRGTSFDGFARDFHSGSVRARLAIRTIPHFFEGYDGGVRGIC